MGTTPFQFPPKGTQEKDKTEKESRPSPFAQPKVAAKPQSPQPKPPTTQQSNPFLAFRQKDADKQRNEPAKPFSAFRTTQTTIPQDPAKPFAQQKRETPSPFATKGTNPLAKQPSFLKQPLGTQTQKPAQPSPKPFFRATPPSDRATTPFRQQRSFGSSPNLTTDLSVTNEEFILLRDFIYKKCGIFIAENRKYLIENRLSNRLKYLNLKNFTEYYKYLKFDDNREAELNELYVLMTTNETSFFRNPPQLKVFQDIVLTNLVGQLKKTGQKRLRIWSAGCSTGEEPYTLAIIVAEVLRTELPAWDVKITANDLSTQVLAAARQGIYSEYALRTTPKDIVARYFTKDKQVYKINESMKRLISFGQINLNERDQLKKVENSHIVFCRNVIIYFDDDMKRRVINAFYDNLLPGGALLIGHSETLHNICRSFQLEHYTGTIVYRKQR